jgi:hypothetical protein
MLLTHAAIDPFSPQIEAAAFQVMAHQPDDTRLVQTKLGLNSLEWRPVFPCHLNDPVYIGQIHTYGNKHRKIKFITALPY